VEKILHQAEHLEEGYSWLGAAESYDEALKLVPKNDFSRMGQTGERLGHAFYRATMQAENQAEFGERMQRAVGAWEQAHEFYKRLVDKRESARMFRYEAVVKYLGYWLASVPSEKRKLLDECLELEGKALEAFLESGDMMEYGKTYNELSLVFLCRFYIEWDRGSGQCFYLFPRGTLRRTIQHRHLASEPTRRLCRWDLRLSSVESNFVAHLVSETAFSFHTFHGYFNN